MRTVAGPDADFLMPEILQYEKTSTKILCIFLQACDCSSKSSAVPRKRQPWIWASLASRWLCGWAGTLLVLLTALLLATNTILFGWLLFTNFLITEWGKVRTRKSMFFWLLNQYILIGRTMWSPQEWKKQFSSLRVEQILYEKKTSDPFSSGEDLYRNRLWPY